MSENYVEYVFNSFDSVPADSSVHNLKLDDTQVARIIGILQQKHIKSYERLLKMYIVENMHYEMTVDAENHTKPTDIKVYKKTSLSQAYINNSIIRIGYEKEKLPMHSFPSTTNIDCIMYMRRFVFRKSNRIFVNFESTLDTSSKQPFWKGYINVNFDSDTDKTFIDCELEPLLKLITDALLDSTS